MQRKVFFSFHFDNDAWRGSQVRNMGVLEGNEPVSSNDWEAVKRGGDAAIERWIAAQMKGRTCAVVLVGAETASRPWVKHEIRKAWTDGLGVVGIRIHGLKNRLGNTSIAGGNPFDGFNLNGTSLSQIVKLYSPIGADSQAVYADINKKLDSLVEEAIKIRNKY
ncbi:TIR domain-containing protein [Bradyrhizobium sp. S3.2.12]|uniref:TIR domain-containing protein n=1 Tax=Bradyrhizobium sp. S3.2.12 TaxID=3156387 RepID=UPI0033975CF9